jgi:hypothetical protein
LPAAGLIFLSRKSNDPGSRYQGSPTRTVVYNDAVIEHPRLAETLLVLLEAARLRSTISVVAW